MNAAQLTKYGDKDALAYSENVAKPQLAPGQVLILVRAAACNPFDHKVRDGLMQSMAKLHLPATLGGDCAGIVAELGPDVTGFEVGQHVYGQAGALSGNGSFAEYTCVKASSLALSPQNLDFVQAAALPLAACSAWQALVDHIGLKPGQTVLVHGAAGGIGSLALQIAKHLGARVIATASTKDLSFVQNLGADEVIDYTTQDFERLVHDLDAVFDTVGGATNQKSYNVLANGGAYVSMVEPADDALVEAKQIHYTHQFTGVTTERLNHIAQLVQNGVLKVFVDKTYPLAEAAEALEYLKQQHPRGKVVLQVA